MAKDAYENPFLPNPNQYLDIVREQAEKEAFGSSVKEQSHGKVKTKAMKNTPRPKGAVRHG